LTQPPPPQEDQPPASEAPPPDEARAVALNNPVRVYQQNHVETPIVGELLLGESARILRIFDDWYNILLDDGISGFVQTGLVAVTGDLTRVESYVEPPPEAAPPVDIALRVFVSYSSDNDFADRLHDRLQAWGINVWLDRYDLVPGDIIDEAVQTA